MPERSSVREIPAPCQIESGATTAPAPQLPSRRLHARSNAQQPPEAAARSQRRLSSFLQCPFLTSPPPVIRPLPSRSATSIPETAGNVPAPLCTESVSRNSTRTRHPKMSRRVCRLPAARTLPSEPKFLRANWQASEASSPLPSHANPAFRPARSALRGANYCRRSQHARQLAPRNTPPRFPRVPRPPPAHRSCAASYSSVRMSIACAHRIWHDRQCSSPLIVTRHSKHTPIPQSAPRGSPLTERRKVVVPLKRIAASAVMSSVASTRAPFTVTETALGMYAFGNA